MNSDFPNDIDKIEIDIDIPHPVLTTEQKKEIITRKFQKANIFIFAFVLAATSIFMLTFKRPTISETENRTLAKFPEYSKESFLSGSYTADIAEYYNDTVPLRQNFKNLAASIKSYYGIEKDGIKLYSVSPNKKPQPAPAVTTAQTEGTSEINAEVTQSPVVSEPAQETTVTTPAPIPEDDAADAGELSNNIMIYKNRGIPIYYGSFDSGTEYAAIVNRYKQDLGDSVNVYSMVCPTAISFYWPKSSDISHGSEAENMENVRSQLSGVTDVNIYDTLMQHRAEPIYSRTDHHWQPRGAYYASEVFAKQAGVPFDDLSKYQEVVVGGYVGTLYGYSGDASLNNNPEDFIFYRPDNQYTTHYYSPSFEFEYDGELLVEAYGSALYCTFMGGDEKIVHIETDAPNERTLFIVKDSYGNAIVPFLTNSFKNIFVVDMRYFNLNAVTFMKEHGATDVLFAMNTFSATGSNYQNLERIRTQ